MNDVMYRKGFGLLGMLLAITIVVLLLVGGFRVARKSTDEVTKSPLEVGIDAKKQAQEAARQASSQSEKMTEQIGSITNK